MSAPLSLPRSAPGVAPNAWHAFGGIWRLTVRRYLSLGHALKLVGMLAALVVFSIPAAPNPGAAATGFLPWAATFYVCFLTPLIAFIAGGGAIRDDLAAGSIDYLFTRPVTRPAFVVFRFLSHVACLQINFLLALATVVGLGIFHHVPDLAAAVPLLLLAQVLVITVFSAFGFLCGMLTSRFIIVGLAYGAIIEVGLGSVPTQISRISMLRQTMSIVQSLLPDERGLGQKLQLVAVSPAGAVVLLIVLSIAMVAATALVFRWRELLGSAARES